MTLRSTATLLLSLAGCSASPSNGAVKILPVGAPEPTMARVASLSSVEDPAIVNLPTASPVLSATASPEGELVTGVAPPVPSGGAPPEPKTSAGWVKRAREHAAARRWVESAEAFEHAATHSAGDATLQAEAGAAWFKAGNLQKAAERNASAYWAAVASDDNLRAQIFYNQGRVEEAQSHPAEARALYQVSLSLRPNDTVQRYFDKLAAVETQCAMPKDIDSYCRCARAAEINADTASALFYGVPFQCREVAATSGGRLRVVEHSATESYSPMVILEQRPEGFSLVYEIGRSFEPGAFGVHNFIEIAGVTVKTLAGHSVATIVAEHNNYDQNQGGLEVFSSGTTEHVLCLLPTANAIRCPVRVPVKTYASARYEVDPAADPGTQNEQRRRQREHNSEQIATCKYDITRSGAAFTHASRMDELQSALVDLDRFSGPSEEQRRGIKSSINLEIAAEELRWGGQLDAFRAQVLSHPAFDSLAHEADFAAAVVSGVQVGASAAAARHLASELLKAVAFEVLLAVATEGATLVASSTVLARMGHRARLLQDVLMVSMYGVSVPGRAARGPAMSDAVATEIGVLRDATKG